MATDDIKKEALAFLREHKTMVLSTVSSDGKPHSATVYFLVDDDFTFHCVSYRDSEKAKDIEKNGAVAITVGFGPEPITIQAKGIAEPLTDGLYLKILAKIGFEHIDQFPIFRIGSGGFVAFTIKPIELKWLNLDKKGHPRGYHQGFHHIIP